MLKFGGGLRVLACADCGEANGMVQGGKNADDRKGSAAYRANMSTIRASQPLGAAWRPRFSAGSRVVLRMRPRASYVPLRILAMPRS